MCDEEIWMNDNLLSSIKYSTLDFSLPLYKEVKNIDMIYKTE